MKNRQTPAREAMAAALRLRLQTGHNLDTPVQPVDVALQLGLEVRFVPFSSFEGMYVPAGPLVLLGSLRPSGRRNFTCAHEIGHHIFKHGIRVDQLRKVEDAPSYDEAEFLADQFASALLVPKVAFERALSLRGWKTKHLSAAQLFILAGFFGVGYSTLVDHLLYTLQILEPTAAARLCRLQPKAIREKLLGTPAPHGLLVLDPAWDSLAIDMCVGDLALLPELPRSASGLVALTPRFTQDVLLEALAPGTLDLQFAGWHVCLRISRRDYAGLAPYRHLEEDLDEQ